MIPHLQLSAHAHGVNIEFCLIASQRDEMERPPFALPLCELSMACTIYEAFPAFDDIRVTYLHGRAILDVVGSILRHASMGQKDVDCIQTDGVLDRLKESP